MCSRFRPASFRTVEWNGWPKIYISHGTADRVLPIDSCSRRLAPQLKKAGYEVTYKEFQGQHTRCLTNAATKGSVCFWVEIDNHFLTVAAQNVSEPRAREQAV